ncbi:MAG: CbtA family protein [Chloroflexi bacterium]|nr:CbtA family protein [Chloroflexota bacterium]
MVQSRVFAVARAGILAGLAAGFAMGLFHFVVTEPIINRAIAIEEAAAASSGHDEVALVSRVVQEGMLVFGSVIYGAAAGMLFAVVFSLVGQRLPVRPEARAVALAAILWLSSGLVPFLKYPANPPGVGDPATMEYREAIQFGFIGVSLFLAALAALVYWRLGRLRPGVLRAKRSLIAVSLYLAMAVVLLAVSPANPDEVTAPAGLVWDFRIRSLFGQVLFWGVLGFASAWLLKRSRPAVPEAVR